MTPGERLHLVAWCRVHPETMFHVDLDADETLLLARAPIVGQHVLRVPERMWHFWEELEIYREVHVPCGPVRISGIFTDRPFVRCRTCNKTYVADIPHVCPKAV